MSAELTADEAEELIYEAVQNLDDVRDRYPNLTDELERLAWTARTSLSSIYFRVGREESTPSLTEQAQRDASSNYSGPVRPDRRADGSFVYSGTVHVVVTRHQGDPHPKCEGVYRHEEDAERGKREAMEGLGAIAAEVYEMEVRS